MAGDKNSGRLRDVRTVAAFTMVEIALCLAIIGFALVAIIGVLPTGLSVQKDNREETIINFEANFLMDAIRSGSRGVGGGGPDDLTNYVVCITNRYYTYITTPTTTNLESSDFNFFTTSNYAIGPTPYSTPFLTNEANIIGLLSIPKYVSINATHFRSNYVSADFRGLSGSVMDQGTNDASRDFAFRYRIEPEMIPNGWNIAYDPSWIDLVNVSTNDLAARADYAAVAKRLQDNLNQVRLRFKWPVLPNGKTGNGRQVFRTSAGGFVASVNSANPPGVPLYFVLPQTYGTNQ